MSFLDSLKSVGSFVSSIPKTIAKNIQTDRKKTQALSLAKFNANAASSDELKTRQSELEKKVNNSRDFMPDEQIELSHLNKKLKDNSYQVPSYPKYTNPYSAPKQFAGVVEQVKPAANTGANVVQTDGNGIIKAYNDIKNSKANSTMPANNKYPIDSGSTAPVKVIRIVDGKNKEINANSMDDLFGAYKIRKSYGGGKKTIGNIDLETIKYATNPKHVSEIKGIYNEKSPRVNKKVKDFNYNDMKVEFEGLKSPLQYISGQISQALDYYGITPGEFVAVVRKDSGAGTSGVAIETKNVGNVGNTDDGSLTHFATWIEGSVAAIRNLAERKANNKLTKK